LEVLADRRAVALTGDAAAYGRTLHKIAEANGETQAGPGLIGQLWETHPGLMHRIKKLGLER
jgi:Zn-dependent protease with chaperone function